MLWVLTLEFLFLLRELLLAGSCQLIPIAQLFVDLDHLVLLDVHGKDLAAGKVKHVSLAPEEVLALHVGFAEVCVLQNDFILLSATQTLQTVADQPKVAVNLHVLVLALLFNAA